MLILSSISTCWVVSEGPFLVILRWLRQISSYWLRLVELLRPLAQVFPSFLKLLISVVVRRSLDRAVKISRVWYIFLKIWRQEEFVTTNLPLWYRNAALQKLNNHTSKNTIRCIWIFVINHVPCMSTCWGWLLQRREKTTSQPLKK